MHTREQYKRKMKKELIIEKYRAIKLELADLKRRIDEILTSAKIDGGVVRGSDAAFPFLKRPVKIEGTRALTENEKAVLELWHTAKTESEELLKEIEEWLAGIDDPELRTIIRLKMDGRSWRQIAKRFNLAGDGSALRKKYKKFMRGA